MKIKMIDDIKVLEKTMMFLEIIEWIILVINEITIDNDLINFAIICSVFTMLVLQATIYITKLVEMTRIQQNLPKIAEELEKLFNAKVEIEKENEEE